MKNALVIIGFTAALGACNSGDNTTAGTATDTGNYAAQAGMATDTTGAMAGTTDTAAMAGQSMMSLMQRNRNMVKSMQSTGDPDKDFAAMMKAHHMGATQMAQLEVAQGQDPQLKQMAQKMIDEQQEEMTEFDAFLTNNTTSRQDSAQGGSSAFYQQVMNQMKSSNMNMDHSGSVDQQFAQMMIPHHQGSVDMARAYLKNGANEEKLKRMANKLITDQQQEINNLQAWLAKNK